MAPSIVQSEPALAHPIDLVTRFVVRQDWMLCQQDRDAVLAEIPGRWSQYQLAVSWLDSEETLQVVCRIDVRATGETLADMAMLAALLNQQLFIGHLALDMKTRELELRHTLALRGAGVQRLSRLKMWSTSCLVSVNRSIRPSIRLRTVPSARQTGLQL